VTLFVRRHKQVALTMLGREYLEEVREPLERLAAATARIKGSRRVGTVSICVYPTFAIRWLIPRWGRFYDRHPEIDVRLTTSLNPVDFRSGDYDLAIRVGREGGVLQGLMSHRLVDVDVFPVCGPAIAAAVKEPEDLRGQTLLHSAPRPLDWQRWLAAAGIDGVDLGGPQFDSLNLAFQGAIEGFGIAMGIGALVEDDLAQGRLVRLFDVSRKSGRPFHLVYPAAKARDPRLAVFRDWLLEEAGVLEADR